ncbi:MAG: hypothetical protein EAX90_11150 [Candidatus Heimdallarchaeota archaeon]|nr:hypothetical protein [Candidatus Heimdallarchaeota archaeon]
MKIFKLHQFKQISILMVRIDILQNFFLQVGFFIRYFLSQEYLTIILEFLLNYIVQMMLVGQMEVLFSIQLITDFLGYSIQLNYQPQHQFPFSL